MLYSIYYKGLDFLNFVPIQDVILHQNDYVTQYLIYVAEDLIMCYVTCYVTCYIGI